jgi:hypothetical protein
MKRNLLVGWGESLTRVKIDPKCMFKMSNIKIHQLKETKKNYHIIFIYEIKKCHQVIEITYSFLVLVLSIPDQTRIIENNFISFFCIGRIID